MTKKLCQNIGGNKISDSEVSPNWVRSNRRREREREIRRVNDHLMPEPKVSDYNGQYTKQKSPNTEAGGVLPSVWQAEIALPLVEVLGIKDALAFFHIVLGT